MIISGSSNKSWRKFADHLMKTEDGLQRVAVKEIRGLAGDTVLEAFRELEMLGEGVRSRKFYYHANIDPRADEHMTEEQWDQAVDMLEHNLGLHGQERVIVEHEKNGRVHRHVIWSRVDTDSMTVVRDSHNYVTHMRTADELEKLFGHERTPRGRGPDGPNPKNYEVRRGKESGIAPKDVGAEITDLWRTADTGQAFAAALEEHGYIPARGDQRGYVVLDPAGDVHSLAKRIAGARTKDINARMKDVPLDSLPTVEEARKIARQRAAERKERDEAHPDPAPLPADASPNRKRGPSPFGEIAEELAHAAKEAFRKQEPELSAAAADVAKPERSLFERFAENLAKASREGAPALEALAASAAIVEGEHVAKEVLQAKKEPAPAPETLLSPFDRTVQGWKQACHNAEGDGLFTAEGVDWLARKVKHPSAEAPPDRERTPFARVAQETKQAIRDNGGEPYNADGTSFWQRSVAMVAEAVEQAVAWARSKVQTFVGRLLQERAATRKHEPDHER